VRIRWPVIVIVGLSAQGLVLLVICLCLGKGLKIYERSEAEKTQIFGELMEHEKRITRKCSIANSESIGDERSRNGSVSEAGNERLSLVPLLTKQGALG